MHEIHKLKGILMDELAAYANKGKITSGDLDNIDKLLNSTKNACKIIKYDEEQSYKSSGPYGNMPNGGNFYQGMPVGMNRGGLYGNDGRSNNNNSYGSGRYSGNGALFDVANMIRSSMGELPHGVQREAGALLAKLEDQM